MFSESPYLWFLRLLVKILVGQEMFASVEYVQNDVACSLLWLWNGCLLCMYVCMYVCR
jgi:hypothetical protein